MEGGDTVAGSGPGGWSGSWSDVVAEKEAFLANHPEWKIQYIRALDIYEAVRDDETGQTIIMDRHLSMLLQRVKTATGTNEISEAKSGTV